MSQNADAQRIEKLSHYVCEDNVSKALERLDEASDSGMGDDYADLHVEMWDRLAFSLTVDELLDIVDA
jgi:hypothetical protein